MINKTPPFSKESFLKRGVLLITTVDYSHIASVHSLLLPGLSIKETEGSLHASSGIQLKGSGSRGRTMLQPELGFCLYNRRRPFCGMDLFETEAASEDKV